MLCRSDEKAHEKRSIFSLAQHIMYIFAVAIHNTTQMEVEVVPSLRCFFENVSLLLLLMLLFFRAVFSFFSVFPSDNDEHFVLCAVCCVCV